MTLIEAIKICGTLPNRFAQDIAHKATRYGATPKMEYWILKLANEATGETPAAPNPTLALNFASVSSLLESAKLKGLKFPKIRLQTTDGLNVVLGLSGERSREPGSVNVTDGGPYGSNVFYGRIGKDGAFNGRTVASQAVLDLLVAFAADPAVVAASYGQLTGNCSFCNRELSDDRSTVVGYGPVCAEKYSLPWG
jgi:hypothetical protein